MFWKQGNDCGWSPFLAAPNFDLDSIMVLTFVDFQPFSLWKIIHLTSIHFRWVEASILCVNNPKASSYVAAGRIHQVTGAERDCGKSLGELFTVMVQWKITPRKLTWRMGTSSFFHRKCIFKWFFFPTVICVIRGVPYDERKQILEGPIFPWTMTGGRVDCNHVELGWLNCTTIINWRVWPHFEFEALKQF